MGVISKTNGGKIVFLRRDDSPRIYYRIKNPLDSCVDGLCVAREFSDDLISPGRVRSCVRPIDAAS